jgi:hypothetical protein
MTFLPPFKLLVDIIQLPMIFLCDQIAHLSVFSFLPWAAPPKRSFAWFQAIIPQFDV